MEAKSNMTTFYIVRHGESEANVLGIVQGTGVGTPLTTKGKKQAAELADVVKNFGISAIYTSISLRAKETGDIIGEKLSLPVHISKDIMERNFGTYEGMPIKDFLAKYVGFAKLTMEEKFDYQIDEQEESNRSALQRLTKFLVETAPRHPNEAVLVVTHGGLIRAFMIHNGLGDFDSIGGLDNCGYIKVEADKDSYKIVESIGVRTWDEKQGKA